MNTKFNLVKAVMTLGVFVLSFQVNAQETVIKTTELPKTAQDFISKNFSGQKVSQAIKDKGMISTDYEVWLDNGVKIEFDGNGNWEEVDGENDAVIPTGFIPKKITSYVSKNFPTHKISKIEKDSNSYDVELTNGLDLEFKLNGDFLRIDD
ncbi:PepSY-like domain-containing protein [Moheibacter sediminis]|uniref:Putative beta-lactamase-inhibitor-like, PepSY-like n=1 Tax=Moheibacter sediminis TaxID=1434700 RepID=A0A1W2BTR8_9FLAO|nr:PepSY-like domain-containing protein [Moheibacter sediminis]SMC76126.1 Putative beta-lactamase-inhibitor-like, PepSY-like [Moheibacter sediminis]